MKLSICISSRDRSHFFQRVLWGIANRPPSCDFEVVVADDGSQQDIQGLLTKFSTKFPWVLVKFDYKEFEKKTGLKKLYGNPSVTNNIAYKQSRGEFVVMQGNEVIPWGSCYDSLLGQMGVGKFDLAFSTTYDLSASKLSELDPMGTNLNQKHVNWASRTPLNSVTHQSGVTNYLSISTRKVWEDIGGYDERYFAGIACEDSDFIRRARVLPGFRNIIDEQAISLHQYHGGMTAYYTPTPRHGVTLDQWYEYIEINRKVYYEWDETPRNPQSWPWGEYGVVDVIRS